MASSIASQLQALKSIVKSDTDALKRPFTRPSILFNPKEAADIDIDAIYNIADKGLDVLIEKEEKFRRFRNDLFSHKSKELDRELMNKEENKKINESISSCLRLLSGYFELPAARMALEYLIRRYKIHVYNMEELVLCALPYHDTHEFVRIIQLIDSGNSRWKFLDGVKKSGAPPPRKVIVQQCISDLGLLELICNHAMPTKKARPSGVITGFCTAIVIEVVGSVVTVESDFVKRILPYLVSALQPGAKENIEQKAGGLMIVGLFAQKAALSPSLVKSLMRSLALLAQEDAMVSNDMQWFHMSFIALINLVQLQQVRLIPRKIVDILAEIRVIPPFLHALTEEFNIDKFMVVLLDSLIEHSSSNKKCHEKVLDIIDIVALKPGVDGLINALVRSCMRMFKTSGHPVDPESGSQVKQILVSLYKKYPTELREALHEILQDTKLQLGKEDSNHELLSQMFAENCNLSPGMLNSNVWFNLEHPKADVRRSALRELNGIGFLSDEAVDTKGVEIIRDSILRRLEDDDLTVVQAALNLDRLNEIIVSPVEQLQNVLHRCIQILMAGGSGNSSLANDIAVSCLQFAVRGLKDKVECAEKIATMIFPLLLVHPKTQRVNLEALELAKEINWPIFLHLVSRSKPLKKMDIQETTSINLENIGKLGEKFVAHPEELMPWLAKCCNGMALSKTLVFLVLLQSLMIPVIDAARLSVLYDATFEFLRSEWESLESTWTAMNADELNLLDGDCRRFLAHLLGTNTDKLNTEILVHIFWRLLEALFKTAPQDDNKGAWLSKLHNLFMFFASSSHNFKKHLHFLVTNCKIWPPRFLCKMFSGEGTPAKPQAESLYSFAHLCSGSDESLAIQLLAEFPSILVPLSSDNQDVRFAAMRSIEELHTMSSRIGLSRCRNGNTAVWFQFLGELLGLIVQQKRLILSDKDFLPSFFKSLLSQSSDSLLVEPTIGKRFDQSTKDEILVFLLGLPLQLSAHAKLKVLSLLKGLGSKVTEVADIKSLLYNLLSRRHQRHILHDSTSLELSKTEVDLLCILLECCTMPTSSIVENDTGKLILEALEVNSTPGEDPAIVEPCKMVLKNLCHLYGGLKSETQECIFRDLVSLFRNANADIQNATRDALLHIDVSCSVIRKMLDDAVDNIDGITSPVHSKKKKKATKPQKMNKPPRENALSFVSSLLDVMLLKKDIKNRPSLVGSMFKLLRKVFLDDDWAHGDLDKAINLESSSLVAQSFSEFKVYLQQISLLILEDIVSSANIDQKKDMVAQFNFDLLVSCARSASDLVTRNHLMSLFSTVAKVLPDQVLDHILDFLVVVGDSALTQWDDHSKRAFEDLISAAIPLWLSKTGDAEKLIQIFIDLLPQVAQHQRLSIVLHLLRNLDEKSSFGLMLFQLFRSMVSNKDFFHFDDGEPSSDLLTSAINAEWEYLFAIKLSEQYSCTIWLPSIVLLLQKIGTSSWDEENFKHLIVSMRFVFYKLQDPEISFKLDSGELDVTQVSIGALMEQVVYLLQLVDSRRKQISVSSVRRKLLKENMQSVLKNIANGLTPTSYFSVITKLLRHADKNVGKKALGLLCQTVKEIHFTGKIRERKGVLYSHQSSWLHLDDSAEQSLDEMCSEMLVIVDDANENQLKLAAISAVESLVERFPSADTIFSRCLKSISKSIAFSNYAVSSGSLRATAALINVLGPRALSELPGIMEALFSRSEGFENNGENTNLESVKLRDSITMSVLVTLEAVIDKLGAFLNPYLSRILELLVLHPRYASSTDVSFRSKADAVRKLITIKIPVRLLLPPLLRIYDDALKSGESSLSVVFEMLREMIVVMDKSSTVAYYVQIFDLCLQALDLRSQQLPSVNDIITVEDRVIGSIVCLTDKLTETMFKTLFIKSIEWSGSNVDENRSSGGKTIGRAISFYGLIDKLAERHRSIFVPYFKYLIDGIVRHLNVVPEDTEVSVQKKKKAKLQATPSDKKYTNRIVSPEIWHLRYLIISSLHKYFLYDVGEPKSLEKYFQVLLEPIVSQLVRDPPSSQEENLKPSIKEFDDLLVMCVGQMAVTAASDLLWKSLNHEVLMQTRSEKVRSRILGLRIVKYLVENLREEYFVLLPETIPFMSELLEDVQLPVKSLAQEILKEMESMSGESLRDYL